MLHGTKNVSSLNVFSKLFFKLQVDLLVELNVLRSVRVIILRMLLVASLCCWHGWPSHVRHGMRHFIVLTVLYWLIVSVEVERNLASLSLASLHLEWNVHRMRHLRMRHMGLRHLWVLRKHRIRIGKAWMRVTKRPKILRPSLVASSMLRLLLLLSLTF